MTSFVDDLFDVVVKLNINSLFPNVILLVLPNEFFSVEVKIIKRKSFLTKLVKCLSSLQLKLFREQK